MDDRQFDTISRSLASRTSRRQALRSGGAGAAILGLFGIRSAKAQDDDLSADHETGMGDDGICRLDFEAIVRVGPSSGESDRSRLAGVLSFEIGDGGGITNGSLETEDGDSYTVVGQGSGKSIALRIHIGEDVLVAVGAGDNSVKTCSGEYGGPASGPVRGDLGDWIATAEGSAAATATATVGTNSGTTPAPGSNSQQTSTPDCSNVSCDTNTFMIDPATCECVCYDNGVKCGDSCCPAGMVCGDGVTEICSCPEGTEYCNATCVTCGPEQMVEMGSCQCVDKCPVGLTLCGAFCIDTVNERENCGSCGNVCATGVPCIAGSCICPPGYNVCSDGCKDLSSDGANCGACGTFCGAGTSCQAGTCV